MIIKNIMNINNKKQLNKYDLENPIFNNNYLFHYLIIFNNLNALKLYKFPIYKVNNDNLNGLHLAAKEGMITILKYFIKNYSEYIYNRNSENKLFIHFLDIDYFNDLIIAFPKLSWDILIPNDMLYIILTNLNYKKLIKFLKIFKINKTLHFILSNNNLTTNEKIQMLDKYSDVEINKKNNNNCGLLMKAFNNIDLFNYLIKRNIDTNYYTVINTDNPLRIAIRYDIINNKQSEEFTKNLIITENICKELDKNNENIAHTILKVRISRNCQINDLTKINYSLDLKILDLCDTECWNQNNIYKITPLELVTKLDFNIYSKIIIKNNISINSNILNKIKNNIWLNFYKTLKQFNENTIGVKYIVDYNIFQSKFKDIAIFLLYLSKKYKKILYLPKMKSYLIKNLNYINSFSFSDNLICEQIFPWIITINSNTAIARALTAKPS